MKIQWVCVETPEENLESKKFSSFDSPSSLDSFDLNVFDLRDDSFWETVSSDKERLKLDNELRLINTMIKNSKKTKTLIILPQNKYKKHSSYNTYLKDMLSVFKRDIDKIANTPFDKIAFEPTENKIGNNVVPATFYFVGSISSKTKSLFSEKVTTV